MSVAPLEIAARPCAVAALALALLAACTTPAPPSPPPPPPAPPQVVQEVVPYRPLPPGGADYAMSIPPLGPDGARITVNTNLDDDTALWHFRSGWNVAALNCLDPRNQPILDGYGQFLTKYRGPLAAANTALDAAYRRRLGSARAGVAAREQTMTQVYNYFALPPVRGGVCDTALAIATEFMAAPPPDPVPFARASLARLDAVFARFFAEYEQYRIDSAAWDARYGAVHGASQPGYVAVHSLPAPAQTVSTPVVEPGTSPPAR